MTKCAKKSKSFSMKLYRVRKLKYNMSRCEPDFRYLVKQWGKDKTPAQVNKLFSLLEEVKCPMEPCYNPKLLNRVQKVLRKNKCGYKKLCYNMNLPDIVLGSDFWNKEYQREYENAHELDSILHEL